MALLRSTMSLMIFCLLNLSISERGVMKSPTKIVDSSVSPFRSIRLHFMSFGTLLLGTYVLRIVVSS